MVCVAKVVSTVGTSLVLMTVVVMGRALNQWCHKLLELFQLYLISWDQIVVFIFGQFSKTEYIRYAMHIQFPNIFDIRSNFTFCDNTDLNRIL